MELVIKACAAALIAVVTSLLIKRTNPEISMLLSSCTVILILLSAISLSDGLKDLRQTVKLIAGDSGIYVSPVMKCLAISIITKIGSDLCKDASHSAAAFALEMTGSICALTLVMPLLLSVLKVLGGLA